MIIQGLFIWLMPYSHHHIKQLMVVKCLQSTYSLKIRSVVYPASTCQKDYSSWDYVYVVVFRGLWPSHLPLGFIVFGRATPIPLKRRILRSLRPLQSRLIEWNSGGRSSLRIQVSYTNDRPRMAVFLPRLDT